MINFVLKKFGEIYLWAPDCYDESKLPRELGQTGCGPRKALRGKIQRLIPDKIWGLNVRPACKIHDYSYHIAVDTEEIIQSDGYFLFNMMRLNDFHSKSRFMRWFRANFFGIFLYYSSVAYFSMSPEYFLKSDLESDST